MASRDYANILVTGGCGFVGSHIALRLRALYPHARVVAFDNFARAGSTLNRERIQTEGIAVVEGDVRSREQLDAYSPELIIDCAAEPSVLAGRDGRPLYVTDVNLCGTLNCLELARKHHADFVFLSSSRVYPIDAINNLAWEEEQTRFTLSEKQTTPGASSVGIAENFPLQGVRTLYGATKLSSEFFVQEFIAAFGIRAVVNRCGVISGPWQFGKVDQGVVPLWIARHLFGGRLTYIGFDGKGKQVRDVLHIDDLCEAIALQLDDFGAINGEVFNLGGGLENTISLLELTRLCNELAGTEIPIDSIPEERPGDIRLYITDNRRFSSRGWKPTKRVRETVKETYEWMKENEKILLPFFAPTV